jgi:hypothetical protein
MGFEKVVAFLVVGILTIGALFAQKIVIKGVVKDSHNEEPIPFASIEILPDNKGVITDSVGEFSIDIKGMVADSLVITSVGYERRAIYLKAPALAQMLDIYLERKVSGEVVVKAKVNWGLVLWRKVVKHKEANNRLHFENYSYEIHNKLEIDLNNVDAGKIREIKMLKPFTFVLNNVDSSEGNAPFLPVFLTETISDYFHSRQPQKSKEIIRASKTNGINNESVTKLLGGMYQNVNIYNNFIPVFDKQYVSPLSEHGDNYYQYAVADTVMLHGQRYFHWLFEPKRKGESTFMGDAWIHDSTFAVQRIQLRIDGSSNINYVQDLSVYQDYSMVGDGVWFLSKDKFIVDVAPMGRNKFGIKGRKTTTYRNVIINSTKVLEELAKNKLAEEVLVQPDAEEKPESYWGDTRHEALNKNEAGIYKMIDTLQQMPQFKRAYNTLSFLTTGYKPIGNFEIGPWFNWISGNGWEGFRMRFDLGTTPKLHKDIYMHGYLAYGFADRRFKGKLQFNYFFNKSPRKRLHISYMQDLDNGQNYYNEVTLDNIFALAIRKQGIPIKFMRIEQERIEYFTSNLQGWSLRLEGLRKIFTPLYNLPLKENFESGKGDALNNFETIIAVRFAYLEKFLDGNYFRTSLGSDYPIAELKYARGWPGVLNSNYSYHKINFRVNGFEKIAPYGSLEYSAYAGKTFGTLPYMLLDVAPGNEIYYYNKYAFNLMNRFEYLNDRYAGFMLEHNIGNGLFKYIGITRKMKLRQFWNVRTLWGNLTDANRELNFIAGYPFQDLAGRMYGEVGTGVDNIFKVLRFDFIWRVAPRPLPEARVAKFGIFGSFRVAF